MTHRNLLWKNGKNSYGKSLWFFKACRSRTKARLHACNRASSSLPFEQSTRSSCIDSSSTLRNCGHPNLQYLGRKEMDESRLPTSILRCKSLIWTVVQSCWRVLWQLNKATGTNREGNARLRLCTIALVLLYLLGTGPVLYLYTVYRLVGNVGAIAMQWLAHFAGDPRNKIAVRLFRAHGRRLWKEAERAISGDYSRQVMAGYLLYNCTAPGESYVGACIRYRMSLINRSIITELEERQLRKLGYQKSERDLFR